MPYQPLPPYPYAKSRDRNRKELASIGAKFVSGDPLMLTVEYKGKRYEFESHAAVSAFVRQMRRHV